MSYNMLYDKLIDYYDTGHRQYLKKKDDIIRETGSVEPYLYSFGGRNV